MNVLRVACAQEAPCNSWKPVPDWPGLYWDEGEGTLPEFALYLQWTNTAQPDEKGLAWLGLMQPETDLALHVQLDAIDCAPGWLVFHQNRLLLSLPETLIPEQRQAMALDWAAFFLTATGEPLNTLHEHLQVQAWRLQNYQTLLRGLQEQMQAIRKLARGTRGLRSADQATVRLLGFIHRVEHEMHQHLEASLHARTRLQQALKRRKIEQARQQPHHLLSGNLHLDVLLPVSLLQQLDEQAGQASEIVESLNQKRRALQSILRLERDEEMSHMSRQQHWFSFILAALAVMTAIPLITGELDGQGLTTALQGLPEPLNGLALLAEGIRPWFSGLALAGSLLLMGSALLLALRRMGRMPERFRQTVAATGEAVASLTALEDQASDLQCARSMAHALRLAQQSDALGRFLCEAELGCRRPFPLRALESARTLRLQVSRPGQWLRKPEWLWIQQHHGED